MRALILVAALAVATPAAAQGLRGLTLQHDAELQGQRDLARQRDVELNNRLSRLEAGEQTDQALHDAPGLRLPSLAPPPIPTDPNAPLPVIDMGKMVSIPDSILADSNARARAASQNRR
jgi:hypothetical protein